MITREMLKRVLADAPLPHTAGEDAMGRAPIVASNGRMLGWAASRSTNWRAVAELWANAPETIQKLYTTIDDLHERISKTDNDRDELSTALHYAVRDEERYRAALVSIRTFCQSGTWEHGRDGDESGVWVTCEGRHTVEAMVEEVLGA